MDLGSTIIITAIGSWAVGLVSDKTYQYIHRYLKWRQFRKIFGEDVGKEFYIVYKSSQADRQTRFPAERPIIFQPIDGTTNLSTINSCATTRSVGYLLHEFGKRIKNMPSLCSHSETAQKMDISFVSIGGGNYKTNDLLKDPSNIFLDYRHPVIIDKSSSKELVRNKDKYDYGFIIKISPKNHPTRRWICCFGIGEWACSGSAYYLANNWQKIQSIVGDRPFAYITKTEYGKDDSTSTVAGPFFSSDDVEKFAEKISKTANSQ